MLCGNSAALSSYEVKVDKMEAENAIVNAEKDSILADLYHQKGDFSDWRDKFIEYLHEDNEELFKIVSYIADLRGCDETKQKLARIAILDIVDAHQERWASDKAKEVLYCE